MSGVRQSCDARNGIPARLRPLLVVVALLASCKEGKITEVPVDVDRVDLTAPQTSVVAGQTLQLTAVARSASGQGMTARTITWSSTAAQIARVDNGVVTGVSPGQATISAASGGKSASVTITVTAAARIQLSATTISFSGTAGGADPAARTVNVTNSGGGTLSGLTGTINYAAGQTTGWLEGNFDQAVPATAPTTVTLRARITGLPAGNYTATVSFASPVAQNSPQTLTVQLSLAAPQVPPVLTSVSSGLVQVNAPASSCSGLIGYSLFQHTISYTDANGDVTDPVGGVFTFQFSNEGSATPIVFVATRNGTASTGTFQLFTCYRFGTATSVTQTVIILDEAGLYSNEVQVVFPRPTGANSPAQMAGPSAALLPARNEAGPARR